MLRLLLVKNEDIELTMDLSKIHFFDPETENRII